MKIFLKFLFAILLFFIVFSFAGTEPWSFTVLQVGILGGIICWNKQNKKTSLSRLELCSVGGLLFLTFISIIQSLSYSNILLPIVWYPISFVPLYSLEHASLFVTYAVTIIWVGRLCRNKEDARNLLWIMTVCGICVALLVSNTQNGDYIYYLTGYRGGVGPFLNRNHAGVFLAMITILMMGLTCTLKNKQIESKKLLCVKQIAGWLTIVGLAICCVFTRSRGGMLSLLIGTTFFTFITILVSNHSFKAKAKWMVVWGCCVSLIVFWIINHLENINLFAQRALELETDIRFLLYGAGWKLLKIYPLWGIGIGSVPVAVPNYMDFPINSYVERLHCDWLEILVGTGIIGGVVLVVIIGKFIYEYVKKYKFLGSNQKVLYSAIAATLIAMCTGSCVDFHFFIPANAFLFFSLVGIMSSHAFDCEEKRYVANVIVLKTICVIMLLLAMIVPLKKTIAWRNFLFGKNLKTHSQITRYENGLNLFSSPRYAAKLGYAYYNASLHADAQDEKKYYLDKAHKLAENYLKKYPKDEDLSNLYWLSISQNK